MRTAINEAATVILDRLPRVKARVDDPRIASGELLSEKQARRLVVGRLQRLFKQLERLCSRELANECAGKTQNQIRAIMRRELDSHDEHLALDFSRATPSRQTYERNAQS